MWVRACMRACYRSSHIFIIILKERTLASPFFYLISTSSSHNVLKGWLDIESLLPFALGIFT